MYKDKRQEQINGRGSGVKAFKTLRALVLVKKKHVSLLFSRLTTVNTRWVATLIVNTD